MTYQPPPWQIGPLDDYDVLVMNHYHCYGKKQIFIAMKKGDRIITEQGDDDEYLWNRLWHKAVAE